MRSKKVHIDLEEIIEKGKEYKFRTAPIDPNDPFRGKYIYLNFNESTVKVENGKEWSRGEKVYLSLATDKDGFARIESASKTQAFDDQEFLEAKVSHIAYPDSNALFIEYPFERFYMEESKAPVAEHVYRRSTIDTSQVAYALVSIRNGEAVLRDVMIDGKSIRDVVKEQQENDE